MPDIRTRMDLEWQFEREYFDVRRQWGDLVLDQMGTDVRYENVSPEVWQGMQKDLERVARKNLNGVFMASAMSLGAVGVGAATVLAADFVAKAAPAMAQGAMNGLIKSLQRRLLKSDINLLRKDRQDARKALVNAQKRWENLKRDLGRVPQLFKKDGRTLQRKVADLNTNLRRQLAQLRVDLEKIVTFEDFKTGFEETFNKPPVKGEPREAREIAARLLDKARDQEFEKFNRSRFVKDELESKRASGQVAAEVTRARQQGAEQVAQRAGQISMLDEWDTQRDERVCPICQPLHGRPRRQWMLLYPEGPPIHPDCRCQIRFQMNPNGLPFEAA